MTDYNVGKVLSIPRAAPVEMISIAAGKPNLIYKMEGPLWSNPSKSRKSQKKRRRNLLSASISIRNGVSTTEQRDELVDIIGK